MPVYLEEITVGLFSAITKGALAKKVIDEGRKPENQAKIKGVISSFTNKNKGSGGTSGSVPR